MLSMSTQMFAARAAPTRAHTRAAAAQDNKATASAPPLPRRLAAAAVALSASVALSGPLVAMAETRLPPIDQDPNRCERAFVGNTIGQANAVSDRILDLRKCTYDGADLSAKTLSGALMVDASFKGTNMTEVVMSKAYALDADFTGANFTNSVLDRVTFDNANMTNANFRNAVITGSTYEGTILTGASFDESLIGKEDVKRLCDNPTVVGESRFQVGCRN
uniref:Thylakoid lumenal 17.4 kDa protein, chloroplastic n=1 Tax=Mantoniella antarctica TaxID=81844 RepID=A0A7S0SXV2_9CHLO|mmetsp:Transcript_5125/g.7947  ORF Transcript_5125/g.7947 Transcript_5125/m.7947 type:complete len:220 (+) Transcript_5125:54-713(+)